jgi:hypothetical protein
MAAPLRRLLHQARNHSKPAEEREEKEGVMEKGREREKERDWDK